MDDAAPDGVRERLSHDLEEARMSAAEDRADARRRLGQHREMARELGPLVDAHPLRERAAGQLMRALHGSGQTPAALAVYRRLRDGLAAELGLDPSDGLRELELAILRNAPEVMAPTVAAGPGPGAGRVPGRLAAPAPAQLPAGVIGFTGRTAALRWLDSLVSTDAGAAVGIISGSPGVGKTALAVHWAPRSGRRWRDQTAHANQPCLGVSPAL